MTNGGRGCCDGCQGTGISGDQQTGGKCWDCRGTGHAHDGPCVNTEHQIRVAYGAASRAKALAHGLEQSRRDTDIQQVVAGLLHELATTCGHLAPVLDALDAAAAAVVTPTPGKVRSNAPATSQAAARAVTVKTGTQRYAILAELDKGPASDWMLQRDLRMASSSQRPRRGELVDMGLVAPTGGTTRHDGSDWTMWALTPLGLEVLRRLWSGSKVVDPASIPLAAVSTPDTQQGDPVLF